MFSSPRSKESQRESVGGKEGKERPQEGGKEKNIQKKTAVAMAPKRVGRGFSQFQDASLKILERDRDKERGKKDGTFASFLL